MKKVIFKIFAAAVLAVVFFACGGGGRLDGTYISTEDDDMENALLIISGNKMKIEIGGSVVEEITFQRVEKSFENGISRGVLIMTEKGGNDETNYEFDGNRLTFDDMVFIKDNAIPKKSGKSDSILGSGNSKILDGVYVGKYDGMTLTYTFSDNKMKVEVDGKVMQENKIKIVVEQERTDLIRGVITLMGDYGNQDMEFKLEYGMALYLDGSNNIAFMKQNTKK